MHIFFIKLSKGRHLFFKLMFITSFSGSRCFRFQVFQGPGPGFRSSPTVARCFKLFTFTSRYLCLQFFFFKYQRKKIYAPTLIVALKFSWFTWKYIIKYIFVIHNYLVTQKISYCKIIYQSSKRWSFFIYEGECMLIFWNIWSIFLVQTSFSWTLEENNRNLIVANIFRI